MKQKTVLITGASKGIGAATAKAFAAAGWQVALGYRTGEEEAKALAQALSVSGNQAVAFFVELTSATAVEALFSAVTAQLGEVDALVNNAGITAQALLQDVSEEAWDIMMDTHAKGTFLCCKAVLPSMVRRGKGRIVNISSMWGQVGASCEVPYSAAKAAVIGLTKALAKEVGPSGITVNCVAPGAIETQMLASFSVEEKQAIAQDTPLCRLGSPEEVAAAILFLASDQAGFITGQVLGVNGGLVV